MRYLAGACVAVVLAACGSSISVSSTWQGQHQPGRAFGNFLVVAVTPNSRNRRSFEVALADLIRADGASATAAVQAAPPGEELTAANVSALVQETGADAALVTRLAARKVSASEKEGRTGVKTRQPANINGGPGLIEFFSLEYKEYQEPGDITTKSTAVVETSLYDMKQGGQLVYTLTTTARFKEGEDDVIGDVAKAIAARMRRDGVVR